MRSITPDDCEFVKFLLVDAGGAAIELRAGKLEINQKVRGDFVTSADTKVERMIVNELQKRFPEDGIVGEEAQRNINGTSGRTWVIDPIDGTTIFRVGLEHWGISIGCFDEAVNLFIFGAVYFPALKQMVLGGKTVPPTFNGEPLGPIKSPGLGLPIVALGCGPPDKPVQAAAHYKLLKVDRGWLTQDYGCGTYSLLQVALGRLDGYCSIAESSWDVAGMLPIIEALGGTLRCRLEGRGIEKQVSDHLWQ